MPRLGSNKKNARRKMIMGDLYSNKALVSAIIFYLKLGKADYAFYYFRHVLYNIRWEVKEKL